MQAAKFLGGQFVLDDWGETEIGIGFAADHRGERRARGRVRIDLGARKALADRALERKAPLYCKACSGEFATTRIPVTVAANHSRDGRAEVRRREIDALFAL